MSGVATLRGHTPACHPGTGRGSVTWRLRRPGTWLQGRLATGMSHTDKLRTCLVLVLMPCSRNKPPVLLRELLMLSPGGLDTRVTHDTGPAKGNIPFPGHAGWCRDGRVPQAWPQDFAGAGAASGEMLSLCWGCHLPSRAGICRGTFLHKSKHA